MSISDFVNSFTVLYSSIITTTCPCVCVYGVYTRRALTCYLLSLCRYVEEEEGRVEVVLEASDHIESTWKEYSFRYKPGDVANRLTIACTVCRVYTACSAVVHYARPNAFHKSCITRMTFKVFPRSLEMARMDKPYDTSC